MGENQTITEIDLAIKQIDLEIKQIDLRAKRRTDRAAARINQIAARKQETDLERDELAVAAARRAEANALATDFEQRTYLFYDDVQEDSCKSAMKELSLLSRRFPGQPLTIIINSPGGRILDGLGLYDHIRALSASGHHITTVSRGMAASMGGILLQAGDTRVVGPSSELLIHESSGGEIGKLNTRADGLAQSQKVWGKLCEILARRSSLSAAEIHERSYKFDWWLTAQEALELGFADQIG